MLARATARTGAEWAAARRSIALLVPSVHVPTGEELNVLLDPRHPDFARVAIGPARPYSFDPRVLPGRRGQVVAGRRAPYRSTFIAAFWPAESPSKVKITSPPVGPWSPMKRRSTLAWSWPNAVPQDATAVVTPARWQAITSV